MATERRGADVVVIGGGIMGASIAWQLGRKGVRDVAVLERSTVASGATGRTGALLRQHYTNRPEATLAHLSLQVFKNWSETVGGDCGHSPTGVVVTVDNGPGCERNIDLMRRNIEMQNEIGIDSRLVTAAELQSLQPFAKVDDLRVAAYEPASGYVDSIAAARSMAAAAIRGGATVQEGIKVLQICVQNDRVTGVRTADGVVPTETVVCAAGPWSTALLAAAGVTAPITALRVQVAIVQRPMELDEPHFVFLDMAAGMFCRPWGPGRTLVGVGGGDQHDEVDPNVWDQRNDPGYPALAAAAAARRMPAMAGASYLHGHAGLYDMTPDAHPIIGATGVEGLHVAAGFSGAGFKKGPAVGLCMAELIADGAASAVDLHPFRLSRFDTEDWREPWSDSEYIFTSDFGHRL